MQAVNQLTAAPPAPIPGIAEDLARQLTGINKIDPIEDPGRYDLRLNGGDWPTDDPEALTMIGMQRMRNIYALTADLLSRRVPGNFMECGVWRGGAAIYMRKLLNLYGGGQADRYVILADSFEGLPPMEARTHSADHLDFGSNSVLAVSLWEVMKNFSSTPGPVKWLPGWLKDTLPDFGNRGLAPLALLRIDCDLYESTMCCLENLYQYVSPGGYVIVDDYALSPCRMAVEEFRSTVSLNDSPLIKIDWTGVYWRKP